MKRVCGKSSAIVIVPLLFLIALIFILAGRTASPKNEIVGEWSTFDTKYEKGELTMKADSTFVLCGKASGCLTGKYEVSERELLATLDLKKDGTSTLCSPLFSPCISGKAKEWPAHYKAGKRTLTVYHEIIFSLPLGVAEKGMLSRSVDCGSEQKSAGRCTWIDINQLWRGGIFFKKS